MIYFLGIVIALISLVASIFHLGQDFRNYFDFVAFSVVLGGTLAVAVIIMPWRYTNEIKLVLKKIFLFDKNTSQEVVVEGIDLVKNYRNYQTGTVKGLPGMVYDDGVELLALGLDTEKIEAILKERLYQSVNREIKVANTIRNLAKYPPAFGLIGTVLGLVSLMKSISVGSNITETGLKMAIALIATLYGLLVANLIVNPAGEYALKAIKEEEAIAEIALQAILLASEKSSVLEAQEMLNSFVSKKERINILSSVEANA